MAPFRRRRLGQLGGLQYFVEGPGRHAPVVFVAAWNNAGSNRVTLRPVSAEVFNTGA